MPPFVLQFHWVSLLFAFSHGQAAIAAAAADGEQPLGHSRRQTQYMTDSSVVRTHADWLRLSDFSCWETASAPTVWESNMQMRSVQVESVDRLYLSFECRDGFAGGGFMYCQRGRWVSGHVPRCAPAQLGASGRSCNLQNGNCEQLCYSYVNEDRSEEVRCGCRPGYELAGDSKMCFLSSAQGRQKGADRNEWPSNLH